MRICKLLLVLIIGIGLTSCEKKEEKKTPKALFNVVPASGPFTQIFTFNAHDTYDDNEPNENLKIRWDWDGDYIFDTEYSLNRSFEHKFDSPDQYEVTMEVVNSEGWTDHATKIVNVYADSIAPVASFYADPDSSSVNTIFYFNASACSDQYTPLGELQFRWDWQNDGIWDTPFFNDSTFYHKYDQPGNYRVLLEVKNNISMTDTTSRKVIVYSY